MHIWLGSGKRETLRVDDFLPYWRRLQSQLAVELASGPPEATAPQPCSHCDFCEFNPVCEQQWRGEDSLVYVAGIRPPEIAALTADVPTMAGLGDVDGTAVPGVGADRLTRLVQQAALQVQARLHPDDSPPFSMIAADEDPVWRRGLEQLPRPDDADVFLDFEGHPFWRADTALFFLFGLLEGDTDGQWRYRTWWAHDPEQEAAAVAELADYLVQRRQQHPGMHVYHYNHTERSALQRLADTHQVAEVELAGLIETGAFVDLYPVAGHSFQVGVESYGLKCLERLTDFERSHDIDKGAGAVIQYERYMADWDPSELDAIAVYNEDDVRATLALRDWLVTHRPTEMPWRDAFLEPEAGIAELDERVAALHAFGPGTVDHRLGDLLGYWWREWLAYIAPKMAALQSDPAELLANPEALTELQAVGLFERFGKRGKPVKPVMRFSFPPQVLDRFPREGGKVIFVAPDGQPLYTEIGRLDRDARELDLMWNDARQEAGILPRVVALNDWFQTRPKPQTLQRFANTLLETGQPNPVTMALLRRELPRFTGAGPGGGAFTDDLADMTGWVTRLDHSYVAIQGPPGTGKTYRGAHLVHALVLAGFRVGITAFSHQAITNLLEQTLAVFSRQGGIDRLAAVRKPDDGCPELAHVKHTKSNDVCANNGFNLVAGTTWLFSSNQMQAAPADVLVIDEAGQLSLAEALAASCSAKNLVLLGDPLQLPQVVRAVHPDGSGKSVLEHVLGDDVTLPDDRGVFLSETRRMHPDVCGFISEQIYEGRLHSHADCSRQTTAAGTGLHWLRAEHHDNATASPEEAELIAGELAALIGTEWTNHSGTAQPLRSSDIMVVAPYNDQVHTIRERLDRDRRTAGVPVGTVDKFQGREAAVVFFSMATSTGADMTRGTDFLFSRNRLNVAVSRARCLAYLVCTEELLNSRARTVEDMRLIATLNAFVEYVQRQSTVSVGA
jgi:uncharacterized protein